MLKKLIWLLLLSPLAAQVIPTHVRAVTVLPLTCNGGSAIQPADIIALVSGSTTTPYYCNNGSWTTYSAGSVNFASPPPLGNVAPNTITSSVNQSVPNVDVATGATADLKVAAAFSSLSSTGGSLNWTGFGSTTQTWANHVILGTATKPATSLFDPATLFNITQNDASTDVICLGDSSSLVSNGMNNPATTPFAKGFRVQTGAAFRSVVSNCDHTGAQQLMMLRGVTVTGNSTVTPVKGLLYIQGLSVPSLIESSTFQACNGPCLFLTNPPVGGASAIASDVTFAFDEFGQSAQAGDIPCYLKTDPSGGTVNHIVFFGGGCQEAGSGAQSVEILDGNGIASGMQSIEHFSVHFENNPNTAFDDILIKDSNTVSYYGLPVSGHVPTDAVVKISQTAGGLTHDIHVMDMVCASCISTSTLINNSISGLKVTGTYLGSYDYNTVKVLDGVTQEGAFKAYTTSGDQTPGIIQLAPVAGSASDNQAVRIGAAVPIATGTSNNDPTKAVDCIDFYGSSAGSSIAFSTTNTFASGCILAWTIDSNGNLNSASGAGLNVAGPTTQITLGSSGTVQGSFQTLRVTTGTITTNSRNNVLVTWTHAFTNANYTPVCTVLDATTGGTAAGLVFERLSAQIAASIHVTVFNPTGGSLTGTVNCMAWGDSGN